MVIEEKFYIAKCDHCGKVYEDTRNGVISYKDTPEEAFESAITGEEPFVNVSYIHRLINGVGITHSALLCKDCYGVVVDDKNGVRKEFICDDGTIRKR